MSSRKTLLIVILLFFLFQFHQDSYAQKNLWTDRIHVSTTGTQKTPSVDFLGNSGNFVVAWYSGIGIDSKPYFRRFDSFGVPLDLEEIVADTTNANASGTGIEVASVANGDFIIVWADNIDSDVYAQYIRSNGSLEGTKIKLYDAPSCAIVERPRLALYSNPSIPGQVKGAICVVENQINCPSSDRDTVFLRFFSFNYNFPNPFDKIVIEYEPTQVDSQQIAAGNFDGESSIDVSPDGTFIVVWKKRQGGGDFKIKYSTYTQGGVPVTSNAIAETSSNAMNKPAVSSFSDNGYVIIWRSNEIYCHLFDDLDNRLSANPIKVSETGNIDNWGDISVFKGTDDFFTDWDRLPLQPDIYGRILDQSGDTIKVFQQEFWGEFPISITSEREMFPRTATFKDRFVAVWEAEGDIYASLYTLDDKKPSIDIDPQFETYAVRYDTLSSPIRFFRVAVDSGARIDSEIDYLNFHYTRVCPAGDSTELYNTMSHQTDTDSFYTDVLIQYAGTKIYYYFEAVDAALNMSKLPPQAPLEVIGPLKIANPGDINVNGVIDRNDLLAIEAFMCSPLQNEFDREDSVFANIHPDEGITCSGDVDSMRIVATDLVPFALPACAVDRPTFQVSYLEIGVGSGPSSGSDIIPIFLINDSTEVGDITLTVNFDSNYFSVDSASLTQRTIGEYELESEAGGCCPQELTDSGKEKYNLFTDGGYLEPGSDPIMEFEMFTSDSIPNGKYHFYLTQSAMNDTLEEPVNYAPLKGKFFVPSPPPVSIVCTPIVDTLLTPGDTLTFNSTLTNHSDSTMSPKFFIYGTTTGPDSFTFLAVDTTQIMMLPPGDRKRDITDLEVPLLAPEGHYIFTAYVVSPVTDSTFDDDSFGFQVDGGSSRPGYGGNQLASSGSDMKPWQVLSGWFGYNERRGGKTESNFTSSPLPKVFSASQNYPNPFNPSTTIQFDIPDRQSSAPVKISIYDLRGRLIKMLIDEVKEPGTYKVHWNGKNEKGQNVASGVYFYRIIAGDFIFARKMIIAR